MGTGDPAKQRYGTGGGTMTSSHTTGGHTTGGSVRRSGLHPIFAPSERLMQRCTLAQKFSVIAVVLLIPLAFVTNSYLSLQNHNVNFAGDERAGVRALRPMVDLLAAVGDVRAGAARRDLSGV